MAVRIVWNKGGEATLVSLGPDTATLRSTVPSPPGSRIEGALEGDRAVTLRIKVHASKRQEDGTFVLEGRPLDLTRELREKLSPGSGEA